jgi:hypothetical protein
MSTVFIKINTCNKGTIMEQNQGTNQHLNYLSGNRSVLTINELPDTSFTIVGFPLPGLQLPAPEHPSPYFQRPEFGETLLFESLDVDFIVMEDLSNWLEIYSWMNHLGAPRDKSKEHKGRPFTYSDATVTVYSSHNNPLIRVHFKDCVPVALGNIAFTEDIQETTTVQSFMTMQYWRYDVELVKG